MDEPHYSPYPIVTMMDDVKSGKINLDPVYQRKLTWTLNNKRDFIYNLFEKLSYVPPILLCIDQSSSQQWNVIDGKQRISTIKDFIDNKFKDIHGRFFKDLSLQHQETILDNDRLYCASYGALNLKDQIQVFQSLQKGVTLTLNAKCAAMAPMSPVLQQLEKYVTLLNEPKKDRSLRLLSILAAGILSGGHFTLHQQKIEREITKWDNTTEQGSAFIVSKLIQPLNTLAAMKGSEVYASMYTALHDLDILALGYVLSTKFSIPLDQNKLVILLKHAKYISEARRTRLGTNINLSNLNKTIYLLSSPESE